MFVKCFRLGRALYKKNHMLLSKIIYWLMRVVFSCDIPLSADISSSVWFCHSGFDVVINPNAVIRDNVTIQHSVTVGEISEDHKAPVIEENVYIGCKACILGDCHIGRNAKIGAGAVVITDVPENSTAVGVPARVIHKGRE